MTKEQIRATKPGRELDAWIAEKVLGKKVAWVESPEAANREWLAKGAPYTVDELHMIWALPGYSTEIAAAWELVEAAAKEGHTVAVDYSNVTNRWAAYVSGSRQACQGHYVVGDGGYAEATTAPEAICKAALLAAMSKEGTG